jgi:hypothetical protein
VAKINTSLTKGSRWNFLFSFMRQPWKGREGATPRSMTTMLTTEKSALHVSFKGAELKHCLEKKSALDLVIFLTNGNGAFVSRAGKAELLF